LQSLMKNSQFIDILLGTQRRVINPLIDNLHEICVACYSKDGCNMSVEKCCALIDDNGRSNKDNKSFMRDHSCSFNLSKRMHFEHCLEEACTQLHRYLFHMGAE